MSQHKTQTERGEIALSLASSLSDMACCVFPPNQEGIRCRMKYIGIHSSNLIVVEPASTQNGTINKEIQVGYQVKVCMLSPRGEGTKVFFRTTIRHIAPLGKRCLLFLSLPKQAKVKHGIRTEARLEIVLRGIIAPSDQAIDCEVHDFSAKGCQILLSLDEPLYDKGEGVALQICDELAPGELHLLQGRIKNTTRSNQYRKYGLKFLSESYGVASALLDRMSFDAARHHFMLSPALPDSDTPEDDDSPPE